ncbi:MAG: response regulator transcription factor [Clostridiales bacterium]|jgi:DNA-binding response OmpR family regulator|nr:response regulator transcription factor [Clostridiales bacterium]
MKDQGYLLLVEDNPIVQANNQKILSRHGYCLRCVETISEARESISAARPRIIILDIILPDGNGLDFLKELRQRGDTVPVLILTALASSKDQVWGLLSGSDDYMTKPYSLDVFLARVDALLRRCEMVPEIITKGTLQLNLTTREASINGSALRLTPREYSLLLHFMQNENIIMNAEEIFESVWDLPAAGDVRVVRKCVSDLRQTIEGCGYYIETVYKIGYRFCKKKYNL